MNSNRHVLRMTFALFLLALLSTALVATVAAQPAPAAAQPHRFASLGNFKKLTQSGQTVLIETSNGWAELTVYRADVVRVRITQTRTSAEPSYSVVATPDAAKYTVTQEASQVVIATERIRVIATKSPLRFRVEDLAGNLLVEDDPGFGTGWQLGEGSCPAAAAAPAAPAAAAAAAAATAATAAGCHKQPRTRA
jgi:hypothetical protein